MLLRLLLATCLNSLFYFESLCLISLAYLQVCLIYWSCYDLYSYMISIYRVNIIMCVFPANTKHLYNVGSTFLTLVQHCTNVIQMFCFHWVTFNLLCPCRRGGFAPVILTTFCDSTIAYFVALGVQTLHLVVVGPLVGHVEASCRRAAIGVVSSVEQSPVELIVLVIDCTLEGEHHHLRHATHRHTSRNLGV